MSSFTHIFFPSVDVLSPPLAPSPFFIALLTCISQTFIILIPYLILSISSIFTVPSTHISTVFTSFESAVNYHTFPHNTSFYLQSPIYSELINPPYHEPKDNLRTHHYFQHMPTDLEDIVTNNPRRSVSIPQNIQLMTWCPPASLLSLRCALMIQPTLKKGEF